MTPPSLSVMCVWLMMSVSGRWLLPGDVNYIQIGQRTNIQDGSVLHVTHQTADNPAGHPLIIGEDVTVGHKVMLHGCTIGNRVLVGMGSILLDGVVVEDDVIIGAGSLVSLANVWKAATCISAALPKPSVR